MVVIHHSVGRVAGVRGRARRRAGPRGARARLHNGQRRLDGRAQPGARGAGRSMRARGESVERRASDMAARPPRAAAPRPGPRE